MTTFTPCGLGPCAANDGHDGTCAQASGWDEFTDNAKDAAFDAGWAAGREALRAELEREFQYRIRTAVAFGIGRGRPGDEVTSQMKADWVRAEVDGAMRSRAVRG